MQVMKIQTYCIFKIDSEGINRQNPSLGLSLVVKDITSFAAYFFWLIFFLFSGTN